MLFTFDRAAPGVMIAQPARGFRYGAEAFWVAGLAVEQLAAQGRDPHGLRALDLGAGSGVIGGLLAARGLSVCGIELRPEWAPLWEKTLEQSHFAGELQLIQGDLRSARGPVDLVVSNPPFFARNTGPIALDPWRAAARTESTATLDDVVAVASSVLAPSGLLCLVVPAERAAQVLASADRHALGAVVQVRVGGRRWIAALRADSSHAPLAVCSERSARTERWYALARGDHPPVSP